MSKISTIACVSILAGATWSASAHAATSGANGTHDPSRMISSDGKFFVYSTGGGSKTSTDGLAWTNGPGLFSGGNSLPSVMTSAVPNNEGIWAPDAIFYNNKYYIYYSIANSATQCAVGLLTTPTLDSTSPNYKLTDGGLVISNPASADYCTIDPCPAVDGSGNLWLSWGSGYSNSNTANTIYITRLDNTTGLVSSADSTKPGHALKQGHIEASYTYFHGGSYFLFWNSGGCCDGASSTYEIHIAKATTISGPYTGDKIFYQSNGSTHGPGQIGIYDQCGADRFTYHYYPDTGGSVLGENELTWGSDGWPVVGAASTTPLKACAQGSSTGNGGTGTAGASSVGGASTSGGGSSGSPASGLDAGVPSSTGGQPGDDDAGPSASAGGSPSLGGGTSIGGSAPVGLGGSTDSRGGVPTSGGSPSSQPASGGDSGATSTSSGCGCAVPQNRGGMGGALLLTAASIVLARSRRRRQLKPLS